MPRIILRHLLRLIPICLLVSLIGFAVIHMPRGDPLAAQISAVGARDAADAALIVQLSEQYGLGQPLPVQYGRWVQAMLRGQFGLSLEWGAPVSALLWDRLALTGLLLLATLLVIWVIAFPLGVFLAVRRSRFGDCASALISFVAVGIPDLILALGLMWLALSWFGAHLTGLFSSEFVGAPWSWATVGDLVSHLWAPVAVLATGGVGALLDSTRANLVDELRKPYVWAARAGGLDGDRLLKYVLRVALIPFVRAVGCLLPGLVSGAVIVSVVMNLPTMGPLLWGALRSQDMYLAGATLMMLCLLTAIGVLLSDILLAWLDPRVRLG